MYGDEDENNGNLTINQQSATILVLTLNKEFKYGILLRRISTLELL